MVLHCDAQPRDPLLGEKVLYLSRSLRSGRPRDVEPLTLDSPLRLRAARDDACTGQRLE